MPEGGRSPPSLPRCPGSMSWERGRNRLLVRRGTCRRAAGERSGFPARLNHTSRLRTSKRWGEATCEPLSPGVLPETEGICS